jgi:TolA-binding protein
LVRLLSWLCIAVLAAFSMAVCPAVDSRQAQTDLLTRAAEFYSKGSYDEALELYRRYLSESPQGPRGAEAAFGIGHCLLAMGRFSGAADAYNSALERYPNSPEAVSGLIGLGKAELRLGLAHEAEGHFQEALARSPNPRQVAEMDEILGASYYESGDFEKAAGLLQKAAESSGLEKKTVSVWLKLADCYYLQGDYKRAKEIFSRLLDYQPDLMEGRPELAFRWAEILYFNQDYDPAGIVLADIINDYPTNPIQGHAILRLGDVERDVGLQSTDPQTRSLQFRKAVTQYSKLVLFSDLQRRAADDQSLQLSDVALLRIVQTADLAGLDLRQDLGMSPVPEQLKEVISRGLRPEMNALALLLLARYQLKMGNGVEALKNYRILLSDFGSFDVARSARSEYEVVARELMDKSYKDGDYSTYVDVYLGDGSGLALSQEDRLRLAESYFRMQVYESARGIYLELVEHGEDPVVRRSATIGLARVSVAEGDFKAALKALHDFLKLELSAEEREEATLLLLDIHYRQGDIEELRKWWQERSAELNTPELRAKVMFQLAMLAKRLGESEESLEMFQRFLLEFGDGLPGSAAVYGYLRDTYLALGDLYYDSNQIRIAAGYYELFIALFGDTEDIAFPLFQSANCRLRLGERTLAASIYKELIRLCPDSNWSAQAKLNLEELEPTPGAGRRRE